MKTIDELIQEIRLLNIGTTTQRNGCIEYLKSNDLGRAKSLLYDIMDDAEYDAMFSFTGVFERTRPVVRIIDEIDECIK